MVNTEKPVNNDTVYNDKPSYSDIFLDPGGILIHSMYFEPV